MRKLLFGILSLFLMNELFAQTETQSIPTEQNKTQSDKGEFSGSFQTNNQFYMRDDKIGATTTQYIHQLSSTDAWLNLYYKINGFNFMMRYDMFNNSPLFNPQEAYSNQGIGFWQISKDVDKFNFTVGYFYDQFGTGMAFRAYEDRNLGIDFAMEGARVIYHLSENTTIKAFTGKQKNRFEIREPIIKGVNIEHRHVLNDNWSVEPGASLVNRTIDENTMKSIATLISNIPDTAKRFNPTMNVFIANVYNTFRYKSMTLYLEYDYKTPEAIMGFDNVLTKKGGNIFYSSLSYSTLGIGINAQYKRIESFPFHTSPLETQPTPNNATVNYLPSLTRQNTYRLLARYNAVVQELGENAAQLEITLKPSKSWQINLNTSAVTTLGGVSGAGIKWDTTTRLFREVYVDASHKFSKKFKAMLGVQWIGYNQQVFEAKANAPYVEAITPFGELNLKLDKVHSFRFEWQYMYNKQDLGSFINALLEFNMAPHWSFAGGDMVNISPGSLNQPGTGETFEYIHYYTAFAGYTYHTTRLTLAYIKQPQGVNCTGGVCRLEPAFSGARLTLTTNF
ncbi:MAG: DUF6029 family protein [Bacteroidota bacterium]